MNQINSTSEVTLTDLRRLGMQGGATALLDNGGGVELTKKYGLISRKGYVEGKLVTVATIANYGNIYKSIRTIKRGNILVARKVKRGKQSILQLTGKGYHRPIVSS